MQYEVQKDDTKLQELKDELGEKVCKTVIDALFELEEYNSSGLYPVEVLWDSQKKKKMVVSDLILYLKTCWMLEKGRHQSDTQDDISNCL